MDHNSNAPGALSVGNPVVAYSTMEDHNRHAPGGLPVGEVAFDFSTPLPEEHHGHAPGTWHLGSPISGLDYNMYEDDQLNEEPFGCNQIDPNLFDPGPHEMERNRLSSQPEPPAATGFHPEDFLNLNHPSTEDFEATISGIEQMDPDLIQLDPPEQRRLSFQPQLAATDPIGRAVESENQGTMEYQRGLERDQLAAFASEPTRHLVSRSIGGPAQIQDQARMAPQHSLQRHHSAPFAPEIPPHAIAGAIAGSAHVHNQAALAPQDGLQNDHSAPPATQPSTKPPKKKSVGKSGRISRPPRSGQA